MINTKFSMNKLIIILITVFAILFNSCNYKLANKHYTVQDVKGYLVFKENEVIFFLIMIPLI